MDYQRILSIINDRVTVNDPIKDIINATNPSQLQCKTWLVDKIEPYFTMYNKPKVLVAAGWHGLHSHLIYERLGIKCKTFDANPDYEQIKLFKNVNYETARMEDYDPSKYDIIICTSCEHIDDEILNEFLSKKKRTAIVALQSNNYFTIHEHINCKTDLVEFTASIDLDPIETYELELEKYTRFMILAR